MIALDTNLLVYAYWSGYGEHSAARRAIETARKDRRGWAIPAPCIAEFWSSVTHPAAPGGPSRLEDASGFLAALFDAGARVLLPREGFAERLTSAAQSLNVRGSRIFDLQIALVCLEGGATEIWSHDRTFVTLPGLRLVDPL